MGINCENLLKDVLSEVENLLTKGIALKVKMRVNKSYLLQTMKYVDSEDQ